MNKTCPYCGNPDCEADWVDIGVGEQQCGPYYCDECGACQIGPHDRMVERTDREVQTGWYEPGHSGATSAPTIQGTVIPVEVARKLRRMGLGNCIDPKAEPAE